MVEQNVTRGQRSDAATDNPVVKKGAEKGQAEESLAAAAPAGVDNPVVKKGGKQTDEPKQAARGRALTGMKEICDYVNRSEPTVLDMIRCEGMPAAKLGGNIWESRTDLIDDWKAQRIATAAESRAFGLQMRR